MGAVISLIYIALPFVIGFAAGLTWQYQLEDQKPNTPSLDKKKDISLLEQLEVLR